jgi:pimeloyl-ACP methyl ester carboxylesterase/DNA-binding CsgD family transcriptional regulator
MDLPGTRFARAEDGVTLGYQVFGQGPVLVWMPSLSNIEAQWRVPALRAAYLGLARNLTVVLYDGRGTGGSDRRIDLSDLGVEAHLRDLRAVLDDAGIRSASLLGYYHSVATAIAFAARSPSRVSRMILFGGAPRMREAISPAQTQALLSLIDQDWSLFADAAAMAWLGWDAAPTGRRTAEVFRTATTAPIAKAWFDAARHIDVTGELALVRAPTLVLHRQSEQQIPVEVARRLADGLPDARLVELPGSTPTLFIEDPATDLALVEAFVTTGRVHRPAGRPADIGMPGMPDAPPAPLRPPTPTTPTTPLTPREREVLQELVAGGSNAEIGRALGIAVHTVERHLASIYRKVGARGRTDAVAYALGRVTETRHGI